MAGRTMAIRKGAITFGVFFYRLLVFGRERTYFLEKDDYLK